MNIQQLIAIQKKHEKKLLQKANVVSVGCGYKYKDGKKTEQLSIVIGVSKKLPIASLSAKDQIPTQLDGVPTDVLQSGIISAQQIDPKQKFRPAMPGISIGHPSITAGTFGCVVEKQGAQLILSNNHVLAASNSANIGDDIYQPGTADGGTAEDKIGTLFDFIPISFDEGDGGSPPSCPIAKGTAGTANFVAKVFRRQHRFQVYNSNPLAETNVVDAALALPITEADIIPEIAEIGKPQGTKQAELGMQVQKYGRTTKYTIGEIQQINVTARVNYGGRIATFIGQLATGNMSSGGDSGSAVLDMDKHAVGLLFAGSTEVTILNPIIEVLNRLQINLV